MSYPRSALDKIQSGLAASFEAMVLVFTISTLGLKLTRHQNALHGRESIESKNKIDKNINY